MFSADHVRLQLWSRWTLANSSMVIFILIRHHPHSHLDCGHHHRHHHSGGSRGRARGARVPPYFRPKRGPKGRKKCLETAPPPLSQHLDPPLHHTNQLHQHIVTIIISVLIINLKHSSNPVASLPILFFVRTNLAKNYIALVLAAFINAGLLEVSTGIFSNFFTLQTDLIQLCLMLANFVR